MLTIWKLVMSITGTKIMCIRTLTCRTLMRRQKWHISMLRSHIPGCDGKHHTKRQLAICSIGDGCFGNSQRRVASRDPKPSLLGRFARGATMPKDRRGSKTALQVNGGFIKRNIYICKYKELIVNHFSTPPLDVTTVGSLRDCRDGCCVRSGWHNKCWVTLHA